MEKFVSEFTYDSYKQMIEILLKDYKFITFQNAYKYLKKKTPFVVLRHDVDISIEKALKIAEIDNSYGIQSTFFLLISSDTYNLHSKRGIDFANRLLDHKMEIGLHFDIFNGSGNIIDDINVLEKVVREKINVVSHHRAGRYCAP